MEEIKLGVYQHFKGNKYLVIGVAKDSETLEEYVVYIPLYDNRNGKMWIRSKNMFLEEIERDGKKMQRFKYIGEDVD